MKIRLNRKWYNFTEKQKRKDKSVSRIGQWNAPHDYVRIFNVKFRRDCKTILRNNLNNEEDTPYPINGRHSAMWWWW